jgi:hypothetical protein
MRRSTILLLGTWLGGVAVYAALLYVFHLPDRDPAKTIRFVSSFAVAAVVCAFATRGLKTKREPHLTLEDHESGRAPADGDIITDRTYDELKREWMKR